MARANRRAGLLLTLPASALIVVVVAFPIVWALRISVYSDDAVYATGEFVGLNNYTKLLGSSDFRTYLLQTAGFVATALLVEVALGMATALALHGIGRGRAVIRLILVMPLMVAPVVSGFLFRWMFTDQFGVVNHFLAVLRLPEPPWLSTVWGARSVILLSDVWLATPFVTLVLYAALMGVPEELLESARVEGASALQTFVYVVLPQLVPALLVVLVFRFGDAFRVFDTVYIITQGGPGGATETLSTYIYRETFRGAHFGLGAAGAVVMAAIILGVCVGLYALMKKRSSEQ